MQYNVSTSGTFCTLLFSHANAAAGDSGFRLSVQMQTIDLCNIKLHLMRERALAMARQSISVPRTY